MHLEHLGWGLRITVLGMGLVFGLLALLWGLLALAVRLDRAPQPSGPPGPSAGPAAPEAPEERLHWPGSLLHASRWVAAGRSRQTRNFQRRR